MKTKKTLSNTKKIRNPLYNIENKLDKKINNNDFIENKLDKKINNNDFLKNKLDKKIINTNDDFIVNIRDLFNIENSNKLDKKN